MGGRAAGFSLIELMLAIGLMSILLALSIDSISGNLDEARFNDTVAEMQRIRSALIGDVTEKNGSKRTSFGYLGDVGALPSAVLGLAALLTKPAGVSAWALDPPTRLGAGWNGPYLSAGTSGASGSVDAWGTPYVYSPGATPVTLVSLGADRVAGGTGLNHDITLEFPPSTTFAKVLGVILQGGVAWSGSAEVELNFPNGLGSLSQVLTPIVPADNGAFHFDNVPFGIRTATLYIPSKAAVVQTFGPFNLTVDRAFSLAVLNK